MRRMTNYGLERCMHCGLVCRYELTAPPLSPFWCDTCRTLGLAQPTYEQVVRQGGAIDGTPANIGAAPIRERVPEPVPLEPALTPDFAELLARVDPAEKERQARLRETGSDVVT